MKRFLELNIGGTLVDGLPRRELFRHAAEHHLIEEVQDWFDFHAARNKTAHTDDELTAREVFDVAQRFLPRASALLEILEKKNHA